MYGLMLLIEVVQKQKKVMLW